MDKGKSGKERYKYKNEESDKGKCEMDRYEYKNLETGKSVKVLKQKNTVMAKE